MIDLHKLNHFVVLARTGSFVKAAEQLHLSQPALSRSIQALERHYRVTLFDRSRSGVFLTAIGKQLLDRAEDVIFNANSLAHTLESASAGVSGSVSFGIGPNAGNLILPDLMQSVLHRFPEITMSVVIGSVETMTQQLFDGEIEFFIGRKDPLTTSERVHVESLWTSGPSFMVRHGHPLLNMENVPLEALQSYPRMATTAWNETLMYTVPEESRPWLRATVELDNYELLAGVAGKTDAVLIATQRQQFEHLTHLTIKASKYAPQAATVGLFTMRSRTMSPASAAVASIIKDIARTTVGLREEPDA